MSFRNIRGVITEDGNTKDANVVMTASILGLAVWSIAKRLRLDHTLREESFNIFFC